jgi:hypothetical protein
VTEHGAIEAGKSGIIYSFPWRAGRVFLPDHPGDVLAAILTTSL